MERKRLLALLEPGRDRRLTLIHAPAGFGKTTLAAQWCERLQAGGTPVAWLGVDQDDNNPVWFLAHLIEAVRPVGPSLLLPTGPPGSAPVDVLFSALETMAAPVVLLIDDWHRVSDPQVVAVLERLLLGVGGLRVVITSRTRSGLPLELLRARGDVVEVDESALRFTPAEVEQLLVDVTRFGPADEELMDLLRPIGGWVAALQLAALDPVTLNRSGYHHSIDAYLAESVLDRLPIEVLDFLLRTAGPDRLCADLVGTLTGGTHGQAMLDRVVAGGLFLRPVDDDPGWYRYQEVFAGCLRRRLDREFPGEAGGLNRRAATWFAAHPQASPSGADPVADGPEVVPVSERELEILRLLDFGRSNLEIARTLYLSTNTVKWHLKALFQKFDVTRRQECVVAARSAHLLN